MKIQTLILTSILLAFPAFAREGRGMHKTKVKCQQVKNIRDAQACFAEVGEKMPTENDANAVLVSSGEESKSLLIEILSGQGKDQDISKVENSDFVAAVVQNDDESSVYYYVLNKGAQVKPQLVGHVISVADLSYSVCPEEEGGSTQLDQKFATVENLLLGMKDSAIVAGTVWLSDLECEF